MSLPTVFATLAAGNQPASLLDTMFNTVAGMGCIQCTAAGGSAISLSPIANMPTVASYVDQQLFSFAAAAANSGNTTVNVSGVGAVQLLRAAPGGLQNLLPGDLVAGVTCLIQYNASQGAFVLHTGLTPPGGYVGFKNMLLNGAFDIWQRGAGGAASIAVPASTIAYTADRWYLSTSLNHAFTVSQQAGLSTGARYSVRVQRNAGQTGTNGLVFGQPLDSDPIAALAGQVVTVSFTVSTGANWSPPNLFCGLFTGTGAGPIKRGAGFPGEVNDGALTQILTQGQVATRYTFTTTALRANITQAELQFFWAPTGTAGANDWFQLGNVQLEIGAGATTFDRRPFVDELARCERHYWKTFPYGVAPAQNAGTNGAMVFAQIGGASAANNQAPITFSARLRVNPTMTGFNPSAANAQIRNTTRNTDFTGSTPSNASEWGVGLSGTSPVGSAVGDTCAFHMTADAEI